VQYDGGSSTLVLRYYVPSTSYRGLRVVHEYGGDASFGVKVRGKHVEIRHAWSDVLTFLTPSPSIDGLTYRVSCVVPGVVAYNGGSVSTSGDTRGFENKVREAVRRVLDEIDRSYGEILLNYIEGSEWGDYRCIFCSKRTDRRVGLSQRGLLSEKFTDYHRVRVGESACPLCHVGFRYEELLRERGPAFCLFLPCEISSVEVADDFKQKYHSAYGACPLNPEEGVALSVLGLSTMQLMSKAWYMSLLKEAGRRGSLPEWIRSYTLRAQGDVSEFHVRFLIDRRVLIYPLTVKIRPKALISSYGGRKKKFVLNTEALEGHTLWRGSELDITEEHLDVLEPLTANAKSLLYKRVYGTLVSIYGLRE